MRFGIYVEMQNPPGKPHHELTWEILAQMEYADQVGFDVYSVIDHHFFEKFSISANPLALFTAAAQRTRRIRFRTALHTLPLENPLRLAGMIAEADILTGGRLECGLGRGHAWLYGGHTIPLEESRPRYEEAIELLYLAWTQERVNFSGKFYRVQNTAVVPKPMQKPHPPLYTGGTSDITYKMAGDRGWGIFVPPLLPWHVLESPLGIYKDACQLSGHEPNIVYIRPVYIDDDENVIRREVEQYLLNFLAFNAAPAFEALQSEEKKAELRAKGYGFYASGALESLTKLTYEEIVEQEIGFIGTPKKVIQQIESLAGKGGIMELAIVPNFGGIEHWKSIKVQQLFAQKVMPYFRGASRGRSAGAD